tara:strand:+ start:1254 stop:1364 length:111 start_codon:yes stop_codon:yes gene_type:complete
MLALLESELVLVLVDYSAPVPVEFLLGDPQRDDALE